MQSSDVREPLGRAAANPEEEAGIGLVVETRVGRDVMRSRGITRFELCLVALIALAVLLPGIWRYSLIDPWEGHYAEVSRRMLQDDDLVRTQWQNEGFRSKPIMTFWLIAGSMSALDVAEDGGYSGEMVSSPLVIFAVRLPFVLCGVLGLIFVWWMLARLVNRRVAWLAFLIILTAPFYYLVARQAITDMPTLSCIMGAVACLIMAETAGDARITPLWGRIDGVHIFLAALSAFILWQAVYYGVHFYLTGHRSVPVMAPHIILPLFMIFGLGVLVVWILYLQPTRYARQLYMYWFYTLVFIGALCKWTMPVGLVGTIAFFYLALTREWARILSLPAAAYHALVGNTAKARIYWQLFSRIEIPRALLLFAIIVIPWHLGMYIEEGRLFLSRLVDHTWNRYFSDKMHGDHGTFQYYVSQVGIGMWPWVALLPGAIASMCTTVSGTTREGRVRLMVGIWAIASFAFFAAGRTKFHHYALPAIPALCIMVAMFIDDLLAGRVRRIGLMMLVGGVITVLIMRDMMFEQKQLVELFIYRYDRPWPDGAPWHIDLSDAFLAFGLVFTALIIFLAWPRLRRAALWLLVATALLFTYWASNVYMSYAGMHWGQRTAIETYYKMRQIHGVDLWYYGARDITDEWHGFSGLFPIDTLVPDHISEGQPMTITVALKKTDNQTEREVAMVGAVARVDAHRIWVALPAEELAKVQPLVELGRERPYPRTRPWRAVNADRLIAWQLYWRGENFWTGDEIWARDPDMKTAFKNTDNKEFLDYLNGAGRAGRRYFVITEAARANGLRSILPTKRAKDSYEIIDTSSNKFTLGTFVL